MSDPSPCSAPGAPGSRDTSSVQQRTVLLVDDDLIVREAVCQLIAYLGYEPLAAADGAAGLELFRANRDRIGAVMLDVVMPGMSGEEVFRGLRRIDPNVRVLIVSGYPTEGACTRLRDAGARGFLAKPFQLQQLAAALDAVLK